MLGDVCTLSPLDMPLDEAIAVGDWVATEAGSRYLVLEAHRVNSTKHRQVNRYRLRCARLPKHEPIPDDVTVIWLRWYPRRRKTC